jgi:hypothetical protein
VLSLGVWDILHQALNPTTTNEANKAMTLNPIRTIFPAPMITAKCYLNECGNKSAGQLAKQLAECSEKKGVWCRESREGEWVGERNDTQAEV